MNPLQKTFLSAIKTSLWDEPFKYEEGVTATDLYEEAYRYEIVGVLSSKLDLFCPNDEVTRAKWSKKAMVDYHKSCYVLAAQVSLCKILSEENIKPVFLKGMASAYYYPNPLLRRIGDIDFLVSPEQFDECCKLLEQNGFERGKDSIRHLTFEKKDLEYECHRYFSSGLTDTDKLEDQLLYRGCKNCITRSVDGKTFYVLQDAEYGIVLLQHLKHHFADGVGFRQVMDWIVYADKVLDDKLWTDSFQKMAGDCGLEQLAKAITRAAQLYLGLSTDRIHWCMDINESLCCDIIEFIFNCSNFGFSDEEDHDTHEAGNIFRTGFWGKLNSRAIKHVPIAKKIVIFRPAAWIYQLILWGINGTKCLLSNQASVKLKKWCKQKELLKQIGV